MDIEPKPAPVLLHEICKAEVVKGRKRPLIVIPEIVQDGRFAEAGSNQLTTAFAKWRSATGDKPDLAQFWKTEGRDCKVNGPRSGQQMRKRLRDGRGPLRIKEAISAITDFVFHTFGGIKATGMDLFKLEIILTD
ncbi:hypothetical protein HAX54_026752 [Datura stramonium]|uniref:Uncharacterized protein n=1 Tax=Datura stramonium TaxID=4076 RepID=A0ABS8V3I4_DATST|nr:hypothetical protein [Datura stramonium]